MARPSVGWRTRPAGFPQQRLVVGELHLVRRRLEETLAGVGQLQTSGTGDVIEEWRQVEEAARIASRALRAAIAAAPAVEATPVERGEIQVGALRINATLRRQWFADREFELTALQHRLLAHMATEPHQVFTKEDLRREVWADRELTQTASINVAVTKLRRCLVAAGAGQDEWLVNLYGVGWSLTRPLGERS